MYDSLENNLSTLKNIRVLNFKLPFRNKWKYVRLLFNTYINIYIFKMKNTVKKQYNKYSKSIIVIIYGEIFKQSIFH